MGLPHGFYISQSHDFLLILIAAAELGTVLLLRVVVRPFSRVAQLADVLRERSILVFEVLVLDLQVANMLLCLLV
jgi:hypothetical protein